jgi:hypothetical protein
MSDRASRESFMRKAIFFTILLTLSASFAEAKELHLDCARANQTVTIDIDTNRSFLQLMWSEGVGEEFQNGDSYMSGPDSSGRKEKVKLIVTIDKDVLNFGEDRICIEAGSKGKCDDKHRRNTLDLKTGELKYDDGDVIAILKCVPAPPGREF